MSPARGGGGSAARLIRSRDGTPRELTSDSSAPLLPSRGPSAAWQAQAPAASGAGSAAVRTIRSEPPGEHPPEESMTLDDV
eukprot:554953-Prymnesium_polylepis.1